jgi:hypothetical protein
VTIKLHIDRLVLEGAGFARMDRARLGAAVQEQLATMLRDELNIDTLSAHHGAAAVRGDAGAASSGPRGRAPVDASVPAEATAAQWGDHIARAVHGALTRDGRSESRSAASRGSRGVGSRQLGEGSERGDGGARGARSGHGDQARNGAATMASGPGRGGRP